MGRGSGGTNRYQVLPQDEGIGIRIAKLEVCLDPFWIVLSYIPLVCAILIHLIMP